MGRIPLLDPNDPMLSPQAKETLEEVSTKFGRTFNIMRGMANHPVGMKAFFGLVMSTYGAGRISPAEAELAYTTASVVNSCFY